MPRQLDQLPPDHTTLARKVELLERQVRELRAARRLEHSSISDGALAIVDPDGTVRATLGHQDDGTVALVAVTGPTPPAPSDPVVTPQLAALDVTWDGTFAGSVAAPADWLRVEVHVGTAPDFQPDQSTLRTTIDNLAGGTVTVPLPYTEQYVILRSLTTSGAYSAPTAAVPGTPRQADSPDIAAGAITAVQLDADAINGKVITGSTLQTSATGARVVISSDDNDLRVYPGDTDDNIAIQIGSGPPAVITSYNLTGVNLSTSIQDGKVYFGDGEFTGNAAEMTADVTGVLQIAGNTTPSLPVNARIRLSPGASAGTLILDSTGGTANLSVSGVVTAQNIHSGTYTMTGNTNDEWVTPVNVSFGITFSKVPTVVVTPCTAPPTTGQSANMMYTISAVTTTGFTAQMRRNTGASVTFNYIAMTTS